VLQKRSYLHQSIRVALEPKLSNPSILERTTRRVNAMCICVVAVSGLFLILKKKIVMNTACTVLRSLTC